MVLEVLTANFRHFGKNIQINGVFVVILHAINILHIINIVGHLKWEWITFISRSKCYSEHTTDVSLYMSHIHK